MDKFWRGKDATRKLPREAFPACLLDEVVQLEQPVETGPNSEVEAKSNSELDRMYDELASRQAIFMPPRVSFSVEGRLEIECFRRSAEKVGGDYYRVKPETNGVCRLYIGDVCGKGLAAGFTLQEIHGVITTLDDTKSGQQPISPHEVLSELDNKLGDRITSHGRVSDFKEPSDRWATFICGTIDLSSSTTLKSIDASNEWSNSLAVDCFFSMMRFSSLSSGSSANPSVYRTNRSPAAKSSL